MDTRSDERSSPVQEIVQAFEEEGYRFAAAVLAQEVRRQGRPSAFELAHRLEESIAASGSPPTAFEVGMQQAVYEHYRQEEHWDEQDLFRDAFERMYEVAQREFEENPVRAEAEFEDFLEEKKERELDPHWSDDHTYSVLNDAERRGYEAGARAASGRGRPRDILTAVPPAMLDAITRGHVRGEDR